MITYEYEVRLAAPKDAPQIHEIMEQAFRQYVEFAGIGEDIAALKETCEDIEKDIKEKIVLVAEHEGEIAGSVRVSLSDDQTGYLSRYGVKPTFQSKGVGRALMTEVDRKMKANGVNHLYLHTASKIFHLVRFYYAHHFYIVSTATDKGYIRALFCKDYT